MERVLWVVTMLGVVSGTAVFFLALNENSAPKQAAGAGLALCCGVLPYVLARAVHGYKAADAEAQRQAISESKPTSQLPDPATAALIKGLAKQHAASKDSADDSKA